MAVCKGCGQVIHWIKMQSGAKMPCDLLPRYYEDTENGSKSIVTEDGRISKGREAVVFSPGKTKGYLSHFATCPAADAMRGHRADAADDYDEHRYSGLITEEL